MCLPFEKSRNKLLDVKIHYFEFTIHIKNELR